MAGKQKPLPASPPRRFVMRLFVAGDALNSRQARENLNRLPEGLAWR